MHCLLIGSHNNPGGPNQVNKNLLKYLPSSVFKAINSTNSIGRRIESLLKILSSSVIIFSGLMFYSWEIRLTKLLNKKIIYIMHGSALLETGDINTKEELILSGADMILCVSKTYSNIIKGLYPIYSDKIEVLMNGINWEELKEVNQKNSQASRDPHRIILFGGGRKTKRNLQVCQAIEEINLEKNLGLHVDVYGYYRDNDDSRRISEIPCVSFHHVIPHDKINAELAQTGLFIQNSEFESFSLAVTDALALGCDVLISKNVGAQDVINAKTPQDIIGDPFDVEEIKSKILYVLSNHNNKRLLNSIDKEQTSLKQAADNLVIKCHELNQCQKSR